MPKPLNPAEEATLKADLLATLGAIREAQADHSRTGHRTSLADVAEIRAGRFMAQHGEALLLMLSASRGDLKVAA